MQEPSEARVGKMLASSATGTTFLVLIQVVSRAFTFLSNQLILRTLSPMILGIAAQLELFQVSILYFSRESIRMAIQRQPLTSDATNSKKDPRQHEQSIASQSVVNFSYLSLFLGIPSTTILTMIYQHYAPEKALQTPLFKPSIALTGVAVLLELSIEPFFAIVQQRMWYQKRAAVEMPAVLIRSLVTCFLFLHAAHHGQHVGVLPFALGHLSYSIALIGGYCLSLLPRGSERQFSFLPTLIQARDASEYILGMFSRKLASLAASVLFQSLVKHLLTQGDSMMLAAMSSLEDQGIYSLASNYGGLIARVIFQPLEESSRNLFSTLLSADLNGKNITAQVRVAKNHLIDILRAYQLLSVLAFPLGPILVPQGLRILGGRQWASHQVGDLLSLYCYYVPFLAFNGITEAFVASAANPKEIQRQTAWMGVFSVCYAIAAYLFLEVWAMGAYGLVLANIVNMAIRTLWSFGFIRSYLGQHENGFTIFEISIHPLSYILGFMSMGTIAIQGLSDADQDLVPVLAFSCIYSLLVLFVEKRYVMEQAIKIRHMVSSRGKNSKTE